MFPPPLFNVTYFPRPNTNDMVFQSLHVNQSCGNVAKLVKMCCFKLVNDEGPEKRLCHKPLYCMQIDEVGTLRKREKKLCNKLHIAMYNFSN